MKKIQTQNKRSAITERVTEHHKHSIRWFRKFADLLTELFPFTKRDAMQPKSVKDFTIGSEKVRHVVEKTTKDGKKELKHRPINPGMTYVVSPFKWIKQHLNIFIILVAIILAFLFTSCGDDNNPVNPGNPPVGTWTQFFAVDSVSLLSTTNGAFNIDTTFNTNQTADTLKITFTASTNCNTDSAMTQPYIHIYSRDSVNVVDGYTENRTSLMNENFTIYLNARNKVSLEALLTMGNFSGQLRYLSIKNIKVYKL